MLSRATHTWLIVEEETLVFYSTFYFRLGGDSIIKESVFQSHVIRRLKMEFPGCVVLKNDSSILQGVPDLIVLYHDRWAMLEVKASSRSRAQPNQRYYVELFDEMSFGAFIYPENEEEVIRDLQHAFTFEGSARFS